MLQQRPHPDFPDTLDPLASANRDQLWKFAKQNGIDFDHRTTPKSDMEMVLRARGLTNIPVAPLRLGSPSIPPMYDRPEGQPVNVVNLEDEAKAKYSHLMAPPSAPKPADPSGMSIQDMRKECRARGIKLERTDNVARLREKLGG